MIECKKCNVKINTSVKKCPLCQNELEEDITFGNFESNVFPYVESTKKSNLWQRIIGLIFLVIVVLCTAIDLIGNQILTWSIFADLAVLCIGASIAIGIEKKRSLAGILFYEYIFLLPISYYWDKLTGMHNWAFNYVIPILSIIFIIANFVLRLVFRRDFMKYFRNIFCSAIIGILCMVFYLHTISNVLVPAAISCILGGIAILSIAVFDGYKVWTELMKRLHI